MTGISIVVPLPRQRVFRLLLIAIVLLAAAFVATHLVKLQGYEGQFGFRRLFNMDGDSALPTWFSSSLMLTASVLLGIIATVKTRSADRFRWYWWGLAAGLFYMSADESASIHEMMNRAGHALPIHAEGLLQAPWVIFGIAIALVVALTYLRFLLALSPAARRGFLLAGTCFLAGALGVEMVSAAVSGAQGLQAQPDGWHERGDFTKEYMLLVAAEESLELLGMALLIDTLLRYLGTEVRPVTLEITDIPGRLESLSVSSSYR